MNIKRTSRILISILGIVAVSGSAATAQTSKRGAGIAVGEYHPNAPRHHHRYHHRFHRWSLSPVVIGYPYPYPSSFDCYLVKRRVFDARYGSVTRLKRVCS